MPLTALEAMARRKPVILADIESQIEILAKDNWVHGGSVTYRSNVVWRVGTENLAPPQHYGADHVYWQKASRVATLDYLSTILTEYSSPQVGVHSCAGQGLRRASYVRRPQSGR